MRRFLPSFLFTAVLLTGCAPPTTNVDGYMSDSTGTTGGTDGNGTPFVANGDPRMRGARATEQKAASTPQGSTKNTISSVKTLRSRLREFEISRLTTKDSKDQPKTSATARFGDKSIVVKIFFTDEATAEFKGELKGNGDEKHYSFSLVSSHYTLKGTLDDEPPGLTTGEFDLKENVSREEVKILYRAYKAKLNLREDRVKTAVPGSTYSAKFFANTFAWVNNWAAVDGPAFYLVDIVKMVEGSAPALTSSEPPVFAFKGASLRTGDKDHPAESLNKALSNDVVLVGNSERGTRRMFQASIQVPGSAENDQVMLDVESEKESAAEEAAEAADHATKEEPRTPPPADTATQAPPTADTPTPSTTATTTPTTVATPTPVAPEVIDDSYFQIDNKLRRTKRMSDDFARNQRIPGVRQWIENYKGDNGYGRQLQTFYNFANPFRPMIEAVGRALDVSPSFAYLTVIESRYFVGGAYEIEGNNASTALGPFQLLLGTARDLGLRVGGGASDERRFFAPSACGAAKYIGQLVDTFDDSDSTVAILGYYQGTGGAARAIECTYGNSASCKGQNYGRYLTLSKNYRYTYAEMDRVAAIPESMRDYVNRKLAIYFISSNMKRYNFSIRSSAPRQLPNNGTVMPRQDIQDLRCRRIMNSGT